MIRNFKALGLAFFALVAMSALGASAAQGAAFNSHLENTVLTGQQDGPVTNSTGLQSFTAGSAGTITCSQLVLNGTQVGESSTEVRLTAEYKHDCTFLGINVGVSMGQCEYNFEASGTIDIVNQVGGNCATNPINYAAPGCTITVGPQNNLEKIKKYHNIGSTANDTTEITAEADVTGISGTKHGFLCPGGAGAFNTGTYKGNATITGETHGGAMDNVWWTA